MSEICFLLKMFGLAEESVLFDRGPQEELLLTDFSRTCCRLWLALYGRRFSCYKTRKNKGVTNTGWRLRGSGKAVKLLQHDAFDALEKQAIEDEAASRSAADAQAVPPDARATFAGLARAQLLQSAAKVVLPATTKKHQRLRDDTKKLVQEKQRMDIATDFTKSFHRGAGGREMQTPA